MIHFAIRMTVFVSLFCQSFWMAAPAWAQRTGDHIVPAIETVCDGDPFSFGLCNAYCEALDCESETPLGTERACSNLRNNYMKKSGGIAPPCEDACPCAFDVESDFTALVATGNAEMGGPPLDPEIDVQGTYDEYCGSYTPNGDDAFVAEAFQTLGPEDTPQGVRLFYWVEEDPATCNELGGGEDGPEGTVGTNFLDYGPWVERQESLTAAELENCRQKLQNLCPQP